MTEADAPVSSVMPCAAEAGARSMRPPVPASVTDAGVTPAEVPAAKASERTRKLRSRLLVIAAAAAESRWKRTALAWPGNTVEVAVPARSVDQLASPADQFVPVAPCQKRSPETSEPVVSVTAPLVAASVSEAKPPGVAPSNQSPAPRTPEVSPPSTAETSV